MLRFEPRDPALSVLPDGEDFLSVLLRLRGADTPEKRDAFLNATLADLEDPLRLRDMDRIVAMIRQARENRETVTVFGDYDADGICAAAIMAETLRAMDMEVRVRLPSRHTEGYGLSEAAVLEAAETSSLLITVDCGISGAKEVALARERGLKVIVTDHHALPETLPPADAVTSPLLGGYPCPDLCGAGVALKICQALRGMQGAEECLDLAALATVADVVPLLGENRIIVREGLKRMEASARPGLRALLKSAGVAPPVRSEHLAFRLGPRLNAAGRLESADLALDLLLERDPARAEVLAAKLEELNTRRQGLERQTTAEADAQARRRPDFGASRCIVVAGEGWNPGLIGLTAGRLCERYRRPAVALALDGDLATGSCRSVPGVNIFEMLGACADLLERFGGHEQAAGLTLKRENIGAFRDRLDSVIREKCDPSCFEPMKEYDLALPFRQWSPQALSRLARLEPTGCGNPAPVFLLSGARVTMPMRRVGKDLSHLQLFLADGDTPFKGIGFSLGEEAESGWTRLDILYRPILNEFRGKTSVEAQVTALRPSKE